MDSKSDAGDSCYDSIKESDESKEECNEPKIDYYQPAPRRIQRAASADEGFKITLF